MHLRRCCKKMVFPIKAQCRITAGFDELRPLDNPHRPHGAWDLGVPTGTMIFAPESGELLWHIRLRSNTEAYDSEVMWNNGEWYGWSNYYYDWAGGIAVLHGRSGYTHVFLHFDANEVLARIAQSCQYNVWQERHVEAGSFWMISTMRGMTPVSEGGHIGRSGEAGTVRGAHVHYEIHRGRKWIAHGERPRPGKLYPEIAKQGGVNGSAG